MSTIKALAAKLGVSDRTIRNHQKDGYTLVHLDDKKIDIEKSVHAYVKYQSEKIRQMKAQQGRDCGGNSGNRNEPEKITDWKAEKEKQAAIKIKLQNELDLGELVPFDAIMELYNKPLSFVKNRLTDLSNQISKRFSLSPAEIKLVDDLVRDALDELNEKGMDELQSIITPIIERHSKYYSSAEEDVDHSLDED